VTTFNHSDQAVAPRRRLRAQDAAPAVVTAPQLNGSAAAAVRKPVFDIHDMSVYYGSKCALARVTMGIQRNLVTAVIGPSGCGKSTFIRSLNRMNDTVVGFRVEGQVLYHGHDVYAKATNRVEVRRRIGMVFQKPNPFPKSIYDNIAWAPRNLGLKDNMDERVERALRDAAIWDEVKDRLKASALSLSGGQQQRLCIARSIAVEPDVLLLDEPASALDPIATASIEELLHRLKHRYTIVIVTHNMQQAARVADRTAFFSLDLADRIGTLVEYADTDTIFSRPVDTRTRDYVTGRLGYPAGASASRRGRRLVGGGVGHQRPAALPAERGAGAVRRAAIGADARHRGLLQAQDPLDLLQLGVGRLQIGGALDDHVDPDLVTDRHLIDQPAEVPLQLRDLRVELVASVCDVEGAVVGELGARGERRGGGRVPVGRRRFGGMRLGGHEIGLPVDGH
jgi:phosphate transport system ATP-binding protein